MILAKKLYIKPWPVKLRDTGEMGDYLAGSHVISDLQDPSKTLRPRCA